MSRLFISNCIKPIYLMDTIEDAWHCGQTNGLIYSIMSTPIIIFCGYKLYNTYKNPIILYLMTFILICSWVLLPIILRFAYGNMYIGYSSTVNKLMSDGFTKFQAINIMASLYGTTSLNSIVNLPGITSPTSFATTQPTTTQPTTTQPTTTQPVNN